MSDFAAVMSWGWWKGISLLCTFHGGGEYLHRPVSLSLSFCLGSMLGTLVCSSLRSRQAYWAAPSTTQCDALLPLRFTPLSPLLFLCRGLMLSMSSTSTCDTAARRGLPQPGSLVFQAVSLLSHGLKHTLPTSTSLGSRRPVYLRWGGLRGECGRLSLTEVFIV